MRHYLTSNTIATKCNNDYISQRNNKSIMKTKSTTVSAVLGIIIIGFVFTFWSYYSQPTTIDCKTTLNKTPYIARELVTKAASDSINKDFEILQNCGNLDSIDVELLRGPMLISIINDSFGKDITYNSILQRMNEYRKTENYNNVREAIIASKTLKNKIATIEDFDQDKYQLAKIGFSSSEIDSIKYILQSNLTYKKTYQEICAEYIRPKQKTATPKLETIKFNEFIDLKSAINTGNKEGKKVLLYFSAYSITNARRLEKMILSDARVKKVLTENFSYFVIYTDDRKRDQSTHSTVGEKFQKLQQENFKTNEVPYFCIINNDGKVLSEIGYTNNIEEFMIFLKNGLK